MYQTCQLPIFHNANLPLPEMLHCISESVGLQINILSMCIKLVGRIAYYHRGHIALKRGSDWNIPTSGKLHKDYTVYEDVKSILPIYIHVYPVRPCRDDLCEIIPSLWGAVARIWSLRPVHNRVWSITPIYEHAVIRHDQLWAILPCRSGSSGIMWW